jgi:hypothetical protein
MGDESLAGLAVLLMFGTLFVLPLVAWCCAVPVMIVYGVLLGLRTRLNAAFVALIPAPLVGAMVAILPSAVLYEVWRGAGMAIEGVRTAGLWFLITFIVTFAVSFIAIGSVVMLTRWAATRLRDPRALSEPGELRG